MTSQKPQGQSIDSSQYKITACDKSVVATPPIGITDLTHAVDTKSKAVLAAEEFADSKCRVEMLKGQLLAEQDRLIELHKRAIDELQIELGNGVS